MVGGVLGKQKKQLCGHLQNHGNNLFIGGAIIFNSVSAHKRTSCYGASIITGGFS